MLTTFFGEFTTGRLSRLRWIGHYLLLIAAMFAVGIGLGAAIGLTEHVTGTDPEAAEAAVASAMDKLGPLPAVIGMVIGLVFAVAGLNINAKRLRDMGLPGGWALLGIAVVAIALSAVAGDGVANLFALAVFLAMALVPGGAFGGRDDAPG